MNSSFVRGSKLERAEAVKFRKEGTTVGTQITIEESPVTEYRSIGEIEGAILPVQGQMGTLRLALQS